VCRPTANFYHDGDCPQSSDTLYDQYTRIRYELLGGEAAVDTTRQWITTCDPEPPLAGPAKPPVYVPPWRPPSPEAYNLSAKVNAAAMLSNYLTAAESAPSERALTPRALTSTVSPMVPPTTQPSAVSTPMPASPRSRSPHSPRSPRVGSLMVRRISALPLLSPRDAAKTLLPPGCTRMLIGQAHTITIGSPWSPRPPVTAAAGSPHASSHASPRAAWSPRRQPMLGREAETAAYLRRMVAVEEYHAKTEMQRRETAERMAIAAAREAAREAQVRAEMAERAKLLREAKMCPR